MDRVPSKWKVSVVTTVLALSAMTCVGQMSDVTAGHEAQFEVASIKLDDPNAPTPAHNLDLDASDYFRYQGGPVTADGYLANYLIFAYKLTDVGEYNNMNAQLPKWAQFQNHQTFLLVARAGDHPTKDSLRSMVRSLLSERFGLKVHTETQQQLAWVLVKTSSGKSRTSQLRPHTGEPVCGKVLPAPIQPAKPRAGQVPLYCGTLIVHEENEYHLRILDYTMSEIAGELASYGASRGEMAEQPAVDGTQMTGKFDLDLHFARRKAPGATDEQAADAGPNLLQALYAQAGLEFKKKSVPVEILVVDRVNEPTPD